MKQALGPEARVGTVDKFQGQEAAVVIISLARTSFLNDEDEDLDGSNDLGSSSRVSSAALSFVLDVRRLNVALSRAQASHIFLSYFFSWHLFNV